MKNFIANLLMKLGRKLDPENFDNRVLKLSRDKDLETTNDLIKDFTTLHNEELVEIKKSDGGDPNCKHIDLNPKVNFIDANQLYRHCKKCRARVFLNPHSKEDKELIKRIEFKDGFLYETNDDGSVTITRF